MIGMRSSTRNLRRMFWLSIVSGGMLASAPWQASATGTPDADGSPGADAGHAGAAEPPSAAAEEQERRDNASINEWRSFREDELRQLERRREDASLYSKLNPDMLASLAPVAAAARASTVEFLTEKDRRLCLGIVIDQGGHILTKASEVAGAEADTLRCRFAGGITVSARVTDMFPPYDLAIVRADATGLRPVTWDTAAIDEPGTIVAAAGIDTKPLSFGVLSVKSRSLNPGFLGVQLAPVEQGALVQAVLPDSAAMVAGVRAGDVIVEIEGRPVENREELIATVAQYSPGDEVRLMLSREGAELELRVVLGSRNAAIRPIDPNHMMLRRMHVPLSRNRTGYPSALQHDLPLNPDECGGPLVDLEGRVIGMNIARSGRIRSLAIPSADLLPLLGTAAEGRFSIPDAVALKEQLEAARDAVKNAETTLASARAREAELERSIENLKKYRLAPQPAPPSAGNPDEASSSSEESGAGESPETGEPGRLEDGDEPKPQASQPDGNGGISDPEPLP